ncbi:MAG TPA: hypothetical protein VF570_03705 [Pyrinomonadaceae bacterium]|jgi:hypothetical protein
MNGGVTLQLGRLTLAAAVLLAAAAVSTPAPAQSGRVIPTPTPTPTPEAPPPPKVEEPKFVPDPDAEKYRLVFTTRYQGGFSYRSSDEWALARRSAFDNFAEHLNRAGAQGYRLVTSLKGDPAVVALDGGQFEYAWTETASRAAHLKPGFAGTYSQLAKKGFRLAAHALLYGYCDPFNGRCDYRDFFLFERRKGFESPRERASVDTERGAPRVKGQSDQDALTAAVRAKLAEGLYPAHFLSKFEILLERESPEPALAEAGTEVRVVQSSSFWERDELPKKVNELGRQGFRLALAGYEIAVMYRRPREAAQFSYVWLKSSKKEFEKELARLQEAGAVFRTTYPDSDGTRRSLVFEQGPPGVAARREYRVVRFEIQTRGDADGQAMLADLAPDSAGAQGELNRLAAEGFVVLALFDADGFKFTRPGRGREGLISEEFGVLLGRKR